MTLVEGRVEVDRPGAVPATPPLPPPPRPGRSIILPPARRVAGLALVGTGAVLVAVLVVEFLLGGLVQARAQSDLARALGAQVTTARQERAAAAKRSQQAEQTAAGGQVSGASRSVAPPPRADDLRRVAPLRGTPVALLEVPRLGISQVVLEGALPAQTQRGPGHVPGTPLPGQLGNAGVVGRRTSWGAIFRHLGDLRPGDAVTVTTQQGRSTYLVDGAKPDDPTTFRAGEDPFSYRGASQLTLATSRPALLASAPLVVTATLQGDPHVVTPLGVRDLREDGLHGEPGALPLLLVLLQLLALAAAAGAAVLRRWPPRIAWLVTAPVLLALLLLTARAFDRLLPAAL